MKKIEPYSTPSYRPDARLNRAAVIETQWLMDNFIFTVRRFVRFLGLQKLMFVPVGSIRTMTSLFKVRHKIVAERGGV